MNNMASRVAAVNRVADQLLASDQRNQESIRTTREQLNVRWGPGWAWGGGVALGNLTVGGGRRRVEGDGEQKGNGFKVILWLYDIERPRQPDSTQLNLTPHNLTQSNPTQPNSV